MAKKKHDQYLPILIIFGIVILILIGVFSYRVYTQYNTLRNHRDYIRQPDAEIQPWMSVNTVVRRFNVSEDTILQVMNITKEQSAILRRFNVSERLFEREINMTSNQTTIRQTLASICKQNHLNCTDVIQRLNELRKR
jgi:hypothetical protein